MRNVTRFLLAAAAALLLHGTAGAQYPDRPIKLIVPTPAGGPTDSAARALAEVMAKSLAQPVLVENRPGAGGAIAAQAVLDAAPDGHTLLMGFASLAGLPMLLKTPPYASLDQFTPVARVGRLTFGLFVHPSVPARSVAELAAHARSAPGSLNYATGPLAEFMAAAQFMKHTGTQMQRVPYKGGVQVMPDLIEGRVQVYFTPLFLGLPHVGSGKLRLLATLGPVRHPAAADVPTLAEAGGGSSSVTGWHALFGPPKMPATIAERLAAAVASAVRTAELQATLARQNFAADASTPAELGLLVRDEERVWAAFVREHAIAPE